MKIVSPGRHLAISCQRSFELHTRPLLISSSTPLHVITWFGTNVSEVKKAMVNSHCITLLQYLVKYHCDVPKHVGSRLGNYYFLEYKFVFEDLEETARCTNNPVKISCLWGGAGANHATYTAASHEKKRGT